MPFAQIKGVVVAGVATTATRALYLASYLEAVFRLLRVRPMASLQSVDADVSDRRDQIVGSASTDVFGGVVVKI